MRMWRKRRDKGPKVRKNMSLKELKMFTMPNV